MKSAEFIFCGNRAFVLEEMLKLNLQIKKICAVKGSYLEQYLVDNKISYCSIDSKEQLLKILTSEDFDFFISNGCPYIVPVREFKNDRKKFINIHPSYLPDLRGADPQPAALLYGRDSGATCHIMDDGIDSGEIISQVKIQYSKDFDINLLYQLTFLAEKRVFADAYKRGFKSARKQKAAKKNIYYTFKPEDLIIDLNLPAARIHSTIKAFNNRNKGARFFLRDKEFKVMDSAIVNDPFTASYIKKSAENEVVLKYEDTLGIKKGNLLLLLKRIEGDISMINKGEILNGAAA